MSRLEVIRKTLWIVVSIVFVGAFLASCGSQIRKDGAPSKSVATGNQLPVDATPRKEPKSRYGNPPVYEVFGVRYKVMNSSYGYQERGVASWYGKKFHGRATSSQETYDMYAMTAAHKTLPLPTYARVRNLRNNKSIVVRINDRGPFVDNRIIDLSYSAAAKLDMIGAGTSLVEVTALSFDQPPATQPVRAKTDAKPITELAVDEPRVFVQVGAFGDLDNAKRRFALLRDSGIGKATVHKDTSRAPALYRIRVGPVENVDDYDRIVAKLNQIGITESHLVTN